ncbi:ATP-dependent RNA helicase DHX30-like isoform X2 [Ornithodoros turicata]|uniref:ATP-dependent RNA helicase DHX30-like isoform X2 n=1 Tax=Ornithodoros turicata TaxID=34597 RepID=UPI0031387DED
MAHRRPARRTIARTMEETGDVADMRKIIAVIESNIQRTYGLSWQTVTTKQIQDGDKALWQTEVSITLPQPLRVAAVAAKKKESKTLVQIALYNKLQEVGALGKLLPQTFAQPSNRGSLGDREGSLLPESVQQNVTHAKSIILAAYEHICRAKNSTEFRPQFETRMDACRQWVSRVSVSWPFPMVFDGVGQKKTQAEGQACIPLIDYLRDNGFLDGKFYPKMYTEEARKALRKRLMAPVQVALPAGAASKMEDILSEFEEKVSSLQEIRQFSGDGAELDADDNKVPWDIMTGNPLDYEMQYGLRRPASQGQKGYVASQSIRSSRQSLPIYQYRNEILSTIKDNQVVVLAGETGSGKTSQVPQYIIEDCGAVSCGPSCNVVVTQPRRISAISMAERVAWERGEKVGQTVGYQVRMKRENLQQRGGIFFCTTGILLRHLQNNPCLQGISHVIVDEVHERNVETDFLLILLQEIIKRNADLRVIIMSATINTKKFSDYFEGAPIITIPGKLHAVKEYYLEDLLDERIVCSKDLTAPMKLVAQVVEYIYYHRAPGAILCFLPGWNEIMYVMRELQRMLPPYAHSWILPLHSKLRHEDQWMIFSSPPDTLENVRKVILATNIAETSITVDDVVYVVDTGLHREQRYDSCLGVPLLDTFETSRSSMRQRKGRAGRLCPGECYFLFRESNAVQRPEFSVPEMLRVALPNVVLSCKLFCPGSEVELVLSQALDPPPAENICKAIQDLQAMGLMDESGELTELGNCAVLFPMAPQLSKGLIYATLFRCVKSIASLAALMSEDLDLFSSRLSNVDSRKAKLTLDQTKTSDHVALMKIYSFWDSKINSVDQSMFCHSLGVNTFSLEYSKRLKLDYLRNLSHARLVACTRDEMGDWKHPINTYAKNAALLAAVLTAAFYPNILRSQFGAIRKGQLLENARDFVGLHGRRAVLSEGSIIQESSQAKEHSWLVYSSAMCHFDRQRIIVHDATEVSSLHILLFAGLGLEVVEDVIFDAQEGFCSQTDSKILTIDGHEELTFRCSRRDAFLIARWRNMLLYLVELHLLPRAVSQSNNVISDLQHCLWPRIIQATVDILAAGPEESAERS